MFFLSFAEEEVTISVHGIELLRIITEAVCVYCAVRTKFVNVLQVYLSF